MIYETLQYCLSNKLKIGIAVPRKDVVIELKERLKRDFNVKVVDVYGGNCSEIEGDIIVFTTHQAFRYINYFDILIMDEIDAFPYKGNQMLNNIIDKCSKTFVYLSATMPEYILNNSSIKHYFINKRYHGGDIPVPKCLISYWQIYSLKKILKRLLNKVVLVYFPTIKIQQEVAKKIRSDYIINSKVKDRDKLIQEIKLLSKGVVFTTTVLERGITIKNVQVVVYKADHKLFDKDTLIQIAGRVGRNKEYVDGEIIFLCSSKTKDIRQSIAKIKQCNV